jgi:hypothetical protein
LEIELGKYGMNTYLLRLVACLFLCVSLNSNGTVIQELHTFSNGEVADAEKVNQNFNYVLDNASGGCSATQQGNNVLIECADGTSGVIAGVGTVVIYPEGMVSETPVIQYNTGDIVLMDNNGVVLAKASRTYSDHEMFDISVYGNGSPKYVVSNNQNLQAVEIGASTSFSGSGNQYLYFLEEDCSGSPFLKSNRSDIAELNTTLFALPLDPEFNRVLFKARVLSAYFNDESGVKTPSGQCEASSYTENSAPAVTFTPPDEVVNAVYPARLEQLP